MPARLPGCLWHAGGNISVWLLVITPRSATISSLAIFLMLKKYLLNFWLWWYGVQIRTILKSTYSFWSLSLANLNILPMFTNLFVPMYQDTSISGKIVSFVIRSTWVSIGSILQFFITIPLLGIILLWMVLPFLCIFQVINFFI